MKTVTGKVISNKMAQTVVVEVTRFTAHPRYHKRVRKTKKYHVHTDNPVTVGTEVRICECAPISKTKFWKLVEEVKK